MARKRQILELEAIVEALVDDQPIEALDHQALDVVESLCQRFGIARWSIDDVANELGIGRSTLYRRFPSRDDLLYAAIARHLHRTLDDVAQSVGADLGPNVKRARRAEIMSEGMTRAIIRMRTPFVLSIIEHDRITGNALLVDQLGALIELASATLLQLAQAQGVSVNDHITPIAIETLVRLALSIFITPTAHFDASQPELLRSHLEILCQAMLA